MTGMGDNRDRFGLPLNPPSLLGERPEEREMREDAVRGLIGEVFAVAERHLGKAEARKIWADTPRPLDRGPKRSRDPERDMFLLSLYDVARAAGGWREERIPAELAAMLLKAGKFPQGGKVQSAGAVEKMIRRLVQKREQVRLSVAGTPSTLLGRAGQNFSDD